MMTFGCWMWAVSLCDIQVRLLESSPDGFCEGAGSQPSLQAVLGPVSLQALHGWMWIFGTVVQSLWITSFLCYFIRNTCAYHCTTWKNCLHQNGQVEEVWLFLSCCMRCLENFLYWSWCKIFIYMWQKVCTGLQLSIHLHFAFCIFTRKFSITEVRRNV